MPKTQAERNAYMREWNTRNPKKNKVAQRKSKLKALYGVTPEQYANMLAAQHGLCAICGREETKIGPDGMPMALCVDHDHETGVVRGLLCRSCNSGIGYLGDSIGRLETALAYLKMVR